jgi:hypothetical protein
MGTIYMADVVTSNGKKGIKVGKAKDGRRAGRLNDHYRDSQWRSFNLLKTWTVSDEDGTEDIVLRALKKRGRPIHGLETFCHSIDPVRVIRLTMGDSVDSSRTSKAWWEVEKLWYGTKSFNQCYDGRRRATGFYNVVIFLFHFLALIACLMLALAVGVLGVVEYFVFPILKWLGIKAKKLVEAVPRRFRLLLPFCVILLVTAYVLAVQFPIVRIGIGWLALASIPITICVFIYRYGMNASREIDTEI